MPKKENRKESQGAETANAASDLSFPEWLKGRLRFGLADDCVILFIPSYARDKSMLRDQAEWASQALDLLGPASEKALYPRKRAGNPAILQAPMSFPMLDSVMGKLYGGATGFTELCGIWRDDENDGQLLTDKPIMIQSLAKREDVEDPVKIGELASFLKRMGKKTKQGAVAVVFNNAIHFISNYD